MRATHQVKQHVSSTGFVFNYGQNVIKVRGKAIRLSPHEADILHILLSAGGDATPLTALIEKVYGSFEPVSAEGSIRVAIHSLRRKLQRSDAQIKTQR